MENITTEQRECRRTPGLGSNYLNIRRRRRKRLERSRAGIFHDSAPYYASNLRPAVPARCFSRRRRDGERAEPGDTASAAFDVGAVTWWSLSEGGARKG